MIAAVKFEETDKRYHFACDLKDLQRGDIIDVETSSSTRPATFMGYAEYEMVGFTPKKKVIGRHAVVNKDAGITFVSNSGRKVRSEKQRLTDAANLKKLLQESHPKMLSTNEIAKAMNWGLDQASGFIKISMNLESKIVQVYKGWYTSKL